jgi:hypothetical protein
MTEASPDRVTRATRPARRPVNLGATMGATGAGPGALSVRLPPMLWEWARGRNAESSAGRTASLAALE